MPNLSTILRNLADIIDANGGEVPELLLAGRNTIDAAPKPKKKVNNRQAYINERVHEVLFTTPKRKSK